MQVLDRAAGRDLAMRLTAAAPGGTAEHGDKATRQVDEVRVFQGPLTSGMVGRLFQTMDGVL